VRVTVSAMTDVFHDLPLAEADPEVAAEIEAELDRQRKTIDMIASENVVPRAVLEAQGSVLTNKYADGYPGRRDYDGCEHVDAVERLAVERAKALFGAEHANVQPYSGSSANAAVLHALCEPGDAVLGFDFNHGGHPTHYAAETFAGRYYRALAYHVDLETGLVDMDEVQALADEHRPKVVFAGWSCYTRWLDFEAFREIADRVGAALVVDMAHFAGLVAAGVHPDPVPYADACTMTVHKTLGGARGGAILSRAAHAAAIDEAVYPGEQGGPLMHVIAAKAVTFRLAGTPEYRERMQRTVDGARRVAETLASASAETYVGVRTGGTDVHQVILDTSIARFDAAEGLERLHAVGVNANAIRIPFDERPEPSSSGIRLGTAALATRGFDLEAFGELGDLLAEVLGPHFDDRREVLAARAASLIGRFPIYP
jgi:glycine hydroxymethyltransferase